MRASLISGHSLPGASKTETVGGIGKGKGLWMESNITKWWEMTIWDWANVNNEATWGANIKDLFENLGRAVYFEGQVKSSEVEKSSWIDVGKSHENQKWLISGWRRTPLVHLFLGVRVRIINVMQRTGVGWDPKRGNGVADKGTSTPWNWFGWSKSWIVQPSKKTAFTKKLLSHMR